MSNKAFNTISGLGPNQSNTQSNSQSNFQTNFQSDLFQKYSKKLGAKKQN